MAKRKKLTPAELRKVSEQIVQLACQWKTSEAEDAADQDPSADGADREEPTSPAR
jgi:hypothetical protein